MIISAGGLCAIPTEALKWNKFGVSVTGMRNNGEYVIKTNRVEVDQE